MASFLARSVFSLRHFRPSSSLPSIPRRLFSSISHPPAVPTYLRPGSFLFRVAGVVTPFPSRFSTIRCRVNQSSQYSPLNSGSNSSDRPPTEMADLFPGCDHEHWLIIMDQPGGENATKQQMIDCYIQTLSEVLGSEEEAKKKIYNVSWEKYTGFGCEIDEETAKKLEDLDGVLLVLPDSYVDPENKDYGAELFVNGEIVQRPPERQRRVEPVPLRERDRSGYNDQTES